MEYLIGVGLIWLFVIVVCIMRHFREKKRQKIDEERAENCISKNLLNKGREEQLAEFLNHTVSDTPRRPAFDAPYGAPGPAGGALFSSHEGEPGGPAYVSDIAPPILGYRQSRASDLGLPEPVVNHPHERSTDNHISCN